VVVCYASCIPGAKPEEVMRGDRKDAAAAWDRVLLAAFADSGLHSGFLALAEEAVRAQPGDGHILLLAATAALLDEDAARAQVFLKRFRKRYVAIDTCHLLMRWRSRRRTGSCRRVRCWKPTGSRIGSTLCKFFPEALRVGRGSPVSTPGSSSPARASGAGAWPLARCQKPRGRSSPGRPWKGPLLRPYRLRCR
jgi:hypothetical protein